MQIERGKPMSRIEELASLAAVATEQAEKESAALRQLERTLESDATSMTCAAYVELQGRVSQQERRVSEAVARSKKYQAEMDELHREEAAKSARENAERNYQARLDELNSCSAEIYATRQTIGELQNRLPVLEQKKNIILIELDRAKTMRQSEEVSA